MSIEWHVPESVLPRYATNFVVQATEHEFRLYFFDIRPPLIVGTPEEQRRKRRELQSVHAECVANLAIAPVRMAELVKLLSDYLKRYKVDLLLDKDADSEDIADDFPNLEETAH